MTSSEAPGGEAVGPAQEGKLDVPEGDRAVTVEGGPAADRGRASRDLTRTLTSTTRVPGPGGALIAEVPNRILALILDVLVLSIVGFVLAWLMGGLVEAPGAIDAGGRELDVAALLIVLIVQLALSFGYFAGSWVAVVATPGMRLLGLRLGAEADGERVGWRAAAIRWALLGVAAVLASAVVYVPDLAGLVLGAVGAAWLLLLLFTMTQRPSRQGLHDRLAHTLVLRVRATRG